MATSSYQLPPHQHAERMRARILAAGLTLERVGCGWRIVGPGVDLRTADLANVTAADLLPEHRTRNGKNRLTAG